MGNLQHKLSTLCRGCGDPEEQARDADPRVYYEEGEQVGSGAFGRVVVVTSKTKLRRRAELCAKIIDVKDAIKVASFSEQNGLSKAEVLDLLDNEILILEKTKRCNFVVTYAESFIWQNEYWIICELCTVGNLVDILKRVRFTEEDYRIVVYSVLKAVEYVHDHGFVHSDVKLENLIVDGSGVIKLCDFGGASKCDENGFTSTRFPGTLPYPPAEVLSGYFSRNFWDYVAPVFHQKRDVWAVGVLTLKLKDGESRLDLAAEYGVRGLFTAIVYGYSSCGVQLEGQPSFLTFFRPQDVATERVGFAAAALVVDLKERPSASELLDHSFVSKDITNQKYRSHVLDLVERFRVAPEPPKRRRFSDFFEPIVLENESHEEEDVIFATYDNLTSVDGNRHYNVSDCVRF